MQIMIRMNIGYVEFKASLMARAVLPRPMDLALASMDCGVLRSAIRLLMVLLIAVLGNMRRSLTNREE